MTTVETEALAAFTYQAVDPTGKIVQGSVRAHSRDAALAAVRQRGLLPMDLRVTSRITTRTVRIPPADLALGLRVLSDLLDAGLPMSRALAAFEELAPPSWLPGMEALRTAVREGRTLASALGSSDLDLPPLESERAQYLIKSAVRLLEPTMIITFGAIIAFVAAALLQAVYSVRPSA